jgi:hypothetical protein
MSLQVIFTKPIFHELVLCLGAFTALLVKTELVSQNKSLSCAALLSYLVLVPNDLIFLTRRIASRQARQ